MPREDYYGTCILDFIAILRMAFHGMEILPIHHSRSYHSYAY